MARLAVHDWVPLEPLLCDRSAVSISVRIGEPCIPFRGCVANNQGDDDRLSDEERFISMTRAALTCGNGICISWAAAPATGNINRLKTTRARHDRFDVGLLFWVPWGGSVGILWGEGDRVEGNHPSLSVRVLFRHFGRMNRRVPEEHAKPSRLTLLSPFRLYAQGENVESSRGRRKRLPYRKRQT